MAEEEWIVRVRGKEYGPVDLETLRDWQRDGRLIPENEVRRSTDTAWVSANSIAELFTGTSHEIDPSLPQIHRRTFGQILSETFQIYQKGFGLFFCLALLVGIPSFFLKVCLAYMTFPLKAPSTDTARLASALAVVLCLIVIATWPLFLAGIQLATAEIASGKSIRLRDLLGRAMNLWPPVAKLSLLVYGSYFIWSGIPLLAILSLIAGPPSLINVFLVLVILALQVYMTARLWVNFLFWQQSSVLAKLDTLEVLRESKELARSRTEAPRLERPLYRGAILASLWFVLLLVISTSAELPFLFVRLQGVTNLENATAMVQNLANAPAPDAITVATYAVTTLIHAALRPLLGIAFVILYFDAKT
jgi:hypothetical protein